MSLDHCSRALEEDSLRPARPPRAASPSSGALARSKDGRAAKKTRARRAAVRNEPVGGAQGTNEEKVRSDECPDDTPGERRKRERASSTKGYALVEVLVALFITIVVMALVAQTMGDVSRIYRAQSDFAVASSSVSLALDDIAYELSLAGQGLGDDVVAVLPRVPGGRVEASTMTIRSNPELTAGHFLSATVDTDEEIALAGADAFDKGEILLVTDARGQSELAEITKASTSWVTLRSRETADGSFRGSYTREAGARALGAREVRYFLRESGNGDAMELVKDVVGVGARVLSRDVHALAFEYLDENGESIAAGKIEDDNAELATIRVVLSYFTGPDAPKPMSIVTAVALNPRSGTVDFERRDLGFRLSRIFYPIDHPVGVVSRIGAGLGVILAAGASPTQDPAYAYTFPIEPGFLGARVDNVVPFEDVRAPVTLAFGPEGGPLAGSLFVAAWGLRIGHLTRMAPDPGGHLSTESEVHPFEGTEAIAQAGGIAFGVDDALYVTSREKGAIYRYRFDDTRPGRPERLFTLSGAPGAIVEGTDGHLYFLMDRGDRGTVWKMAFDETLSPLEPVLVGSLPGRGVSLARDPVEGSLFALVRAPIGDFVVLELDRVWLGGAGTTDGASPEDPPMLFSLGEWQRNLEEGRVEPREIPFPKAELPQRMNELRTDELDFLAFDALGSLYMGATEANLVLKFELARPSGRYGVGLAAGVVERGSGLTPEVRMHAWKKTALGF